MMASVITGRIEVVWLLIFQTLYVYYLVLRLPKGVVRLLGLLPLLPASILVPWRLPSNTERLVLSFLFLWMINTKLVLLAWDKGPVADPSCLSSLPRFFVALTSAVHLKRDHLVLRVKPEEVTDGIPGDDRKDRSNGYPKLVPDGRLSRDESRTQPSSNSGSDVLSSGLVRRKSSSADDDGNLNGQVKGPNRAASQGSGPLGWVQVIVTSQAGRIVLLRSIFYGIVEISFSLILQKWKHLMPKHLLVFLLGFYLYFGCLFVFESAAAIPACLLGLELQQQFNMPFLADSLADFWGRRWNLLVNNLLRVSVYEPVLGLLSRGTKPADGKRAVSTAAAFLVSGLMHEVLIFYTIRTGPSWNMAIFFSVNGLGTILEGFVKPRKRLGLPRLLTWAYTMSFVYYTGYRFFVTPLIRNGMIGSTLDEVCGLIHWILGGITGRTSG